MKRIFAAILAGSAMLSAQAATVLYTQDFENPTGFSNDGGDVNIFRSVNSLYAGQPAGFAFAQAFTVETLLVGGTQAWGTGFLDPQGRAGNYALGMLSAAEPDLLGMSFNVGTFQFLNFQLDISSIDLDRWGGPYVPAGGLAPVFRFSLYDNPSGAVTVGGGTLLDTADIAGLLSPNKNQFNWSNYVSALDATGNTNGNVTLQIDLLNGGYAAMDNFVIAASDTPGDVGGPVNQVPEPGVLGLMGLGGAMLALARRRRQDPRQPPRL